MPPTETHCRGRKLNLGFNRGAVVSIGAGRLIRKDLRFRYLADKQLMTSQIGGSFHGYRQIRIGIFGDILNAVCRTNVFGAILELIGIATRLHTEMTNHLKRYIFGENRKIKFSAFFNELTGQIPLLAGDSDTSGVFGHLKCHVNDTPVIPFAAHCQNIKTAGEFEERGRVDRRFWVSESSG